MLFYDTHSLYISAPSKDIGGKWTQRYDTAAHNCKNIRLRVKTWQ